MLKTLLSSCGRAAFPSDNGPVKQPLADAAASPAAATHTPRARRVRWTLLRIINLASDKTDPFCLARARGRRYRGLWRRRAEDSHPSLIDHSRCVSYLA